MVGNGGAVDAVVAHIPIRAGIVGVIVAAVGAGHALLILGGDAFAVLQAQIAGVGAAGEVLIIVWVDIICIAVGVEDDHGAGLKAAGDLVDGRGAGAVGGSAAAGVFCDGLALAGILRGERGVDAIVGLEHGHILCAGAHALVFIRDSLNGLDLLGRLGCVFAGLGAQAGRIAAGGAVGHLPEEEVAVALNGTGNAGR